MDKIKKLILDTNFLMLPYKENIEIFQEIERIVPGKNELFTFTGVLEELRKITGSKKASGVDKIAAKIALQLIDKKNIKMMENHGGVDDDIIDLARQDRENTIICTNDRELKNRLKKLNVKIIHMRGRNRLEFV